MFCPPGNDLSTVFAPLVRDGRMDKFYWQPTLEDLVGILFQVGGWLLCLLWCVAACCACCGGHCVPGGWLACGICCACCGGWLLAVLLRHWLGGWAGSGLCEGRGPAVGASGEGELQVRVSRASCISGAAPTVSLPHYHNVPFSP
jgi:hypothetical protein